MRILFLTLTIFAGIGSAGVIYQAAPPSGIINGGLNSPGYATWTQSATYSSVVISATLYAEGTTPALRSETFYLTDKVGPETTQAADEIASVTITLPGTGTAPVDTVIFSGLTLGPGTYYLVKGPVTPGGTDGVGWSLNFSPGPVYTYGSFVGATPTFGPDGYINGGSAPYIPAGTLGSYGSQGAILLSVTNTPEPATFGLIGAMLLGGVWYRRRKV